MKRFLHGFFIASAVVFLSSCAPAVIDACRGGIIDPAEDVSREQADYLTYLRLKKGAGPMDQDYILLSYRIIGEMRRSEIFTKSPERVKIALRDVLNYHPTAQVRPAIIHEAVEHELMNTQSMWVVDGSVPYEYVLDVELSEVSVQDDSQAEKKALAVMLVLFNAEGIQAGEWFGILKKEKGGNTWY